MILDLTPEINLNEREQKVYTRSRITLYFSGFILAVFLAVTVIFPTKHFIFSFLNPDSNANTVINPRNENGDFLKRGNTSADKKFSFDASLLGNFSKTRVIFRLNKDSEKFEGGVITAQKAFQTLFYPEDKPIGFQSGTLLENSGNFYIVSNGQMRRFQNQTLALSLGFSKDAFEKISAEDLKYNPAGDEIVNSNDFPEASLFKINDEYYSLNNQKLNTFISESAFLSHYSTNQAIQKDPVFFEKYPVSENQIGFSDGSLLAYGESVYVVGDNKLFPIDSIETFEAMGYDWSDLITASGDEISFYEKEKVLNIASAHPNGTIFFVSENDGSGKWYLIKDQKKHPLPSENIARSWLKKNPIQASLESLTKFSQCDVWKKSFFSKSYHCDITIDNLQDLSGKDYNFNSVLDGNIKLDNIKIAFKKSYTVSNFRRFLSNVMRGIKNNYGE